MVGEIKDFTKETELNYSVKVNGEEIVLRTTTILQSSLLR